MLSTRCSTTDSASARWAKGERGPGGRWRVGWLTLEMLIKARGKVRGGAQTR